jgi:GNAT superfamily N-acetyltransferase
MIHKFYTYVEKDPSRLREYLQEIISLSNGEKEALGFLPQTAYDDAISQKRLMALLVEEDNGQKNVGGYILHGGIYPHARVQQICTNPKWRRHKIASALMDAFISDLECSGFLTVKAMVASDLPHAQAFYGRHGFDIVGSKRGGSARGRTISIRVKNLDTPHLFSEPKGSSDLPILKRFGKDAPFYTFDLNVFFDLIKDRQRHPEACRLFAAALAHRIRLGIAPEFIEELRRTSNDHRNDPVLQMALQLPRLPPPVDADSLVALADDVHRIVFVERNVSGAGSAQARSDSKHLAHSALSRVSGFITSDGALLAARDNLLDKIGIDVAGLDELIALLPDDFEQTTTPSRTGEGFECRTPSPDEAIAYLRQSGVQTGLAHEVEERADGRTSIWRLAILEASRIVAVACMVRPESIEGENRLLIHIDPGLLERELYTEHLLDASVKEACANGPAIIRLLNLAGQPTVTALAKTYGFITEGSDPNLVKLAIGRPLTQSSWDQMRHQARRRTGLNLPAKWPEECRDGVSITTTSSSVVTLTPERFEDLLGPTILLWAQRDAVIVPIRRDYADELFGTSTQIRLPFIANRDASFLARRAYVNTPRARASMRPGLPILFYESGKKGGRAAIFAAARIVDSVLVPKARSSGEATRRAVVDDLTGFSAVDEVLMTTFDNVMIFPNPVGLSALKKLGAVGGGNFISATPVSHDIVAQIVEAGWAQ